MIRKTAAIIGLSSALASGCATQPTSPETIYPEVFQTEDVNLSNIYWNDYPNQPQQIKMDIYPSTNTNSSLIITLPGGGEAGALCDGDREQQKTTAEYVRSLGYAAISVDYPIYPDSDPFCSNPGSNTDVYMEGFELYQSIIDKALSYAKLKRNKIGWDGDTYGLVGYSYGGTAAIDNLSRDSDDPDAVVATSGMLFPGSATPGTSDVLRIDYEVDTGFVGYQKPDPIEDCQIMDSVGYNCDNVTIPGSGHVVFGTEQIAAVDSNSSSTTVRDSFTSFLIQNLHR